MGSAPPPDDHEYPSGDSPDRESVLVVDDNPGIRRLLERALAVEDRRDVTLVSSAAEAREQLAKSRFDVVITDLNMPDEDGISLMRWAKRECPGPSWIILTGHGTLGAAVEALQLGAFDFIAKPLEGIAPLRNAVRNAIDHVQLIRERDRLHRELAESNDQLHDYVEQLEDACTLLEAQSNTIRADLRRAALIQRALLPRRSPDLAAYRVEAVYRPSESVGGDLYDLVQLDDRHVALLIADAAGHGLSAAMLAVMFRNQLPLRHREGQRPRAPKEALRMVNVSLCDGYAAPGLFITAACCLLDTQTGSLHIASAGHAPLLLHRAGGGIEEFHHTGPALGLYPDAPYGQHEVVLGAGDRLLLYTDGLYERLDAEGSASTAAVARCLEQDSGGPGTIDRLFGAILPGSSPVRGQAEARDDVTLLMLVAEPGSSRLDNGLPPSLPELGGEHVGFGVEVLVGDDEERTAVSVRGRGEWEISAAFYERCQSVLEAHRSLTMDLTLCEHMDSTFLGTIHELATHAEVEEVELRIQGTVPPVQALFEELGMERVMNHMVSTVLPLPTRMVPLVDTDADMHRRTLRLLRAHESLASLSDANRREFDPLLEVLRQEVEATGGGRAPGS